MTDQRTTPPPDAGQTLLPCPFCGSHAETNGYGSYHTDSEYFEIKCSSLECLVQPRLLQQQAEYGEWDIREVWNRRVQNNTPREAWNDKLI